ncbi:thioredoxin domain-containing protein [Nocardioides sp. TF02-7]|uniref:DsbA family protein n=1 Tax=Nocardioides sp. TF02-7 TaxID=2917724 RepID=UPI001F069A1E|nr:thioredoxin domain-containing protein [Nocardioides sp. TF02-7]UMG94451.1 DsbA family protein [Nocardioides sp. TF02-7]
MTARRPTPVLTTVLVLVTLVGVIAAGTLAWYWWQRSGPAPDGVTVEAGVVFGDGDRTIDLYLDPACPACRALELHQGDQLAQLADSGDFRVRYHVVGLLDGSTPDDYATRAANAAYCAHDAGFLREYLKSLADTTDPSAGTSDDELVAAGTAAGIDGAAAESFADCVGEGTYEGFVRRSADRAHDEGVTGLPTILVDGEAGSIPAPTTEDQG